MNENQLIFLISQPRSGSTLTQKLLGAHSEIYTRSEPWIMLNSAYSLKNVGIEAEYDFDLWRQGVNEFLGGIKNGNELYVQELKKAHLNLYAQYLDKNNKYFLDKTPRYYFIINELQHFFPNAKYILLIRNPLAVLGSIINTWIKDDWDKLYIFKYDLKEALNYCIDALNNKKIFKVHYEELLCNSEETIKQVFDYLDIKNEKVIEKYYKNKVDWKFGDQVNVHVKRGIDRANVEKWQSKLNNLQYWRLMYDYLNHIGKERFKQLGYDFDKYQQILQDNMPDNSIDNILRKTKSLKFFLDNKEYNAIESRGNKQQLTTTKQQLTTTKQQLNTTTKQLNSTINQLSEVYRSREWRLGIGFQKIFKKIFPENTLRKRCLTKYMNCIKKCVRLLKKIKTILYIFFKSNYYKLKPKKKRNINENSKKLVYVGHSYHNKTKSTIFLQNYLKKYFDIKVISDNSWRGKKYPDLSFINKKEYIGVVFFQLLPPREILDKIDNDNIIFCPMYDQSGKLDFNYWNEYRNLKILNFSSTLHKKLKKWGFESMYIQYFPKVNEFVAGDKNKVFFWQRLKKVNIKTVLNLLEDQEVNIHIHKALDPNQKFLRPTKKEEKNYNITYSNWFDTREEMQDVIKQKGIYVAPREYEGIGQSFLEAMAMGKAVIAVDNPTMNEYIKHNETGYLFDLNDIKKIELSDIAQIQKNAYNYMKEGRKVWIVSRKNIIDFIKKV